MAKTKSKQELQLQVASLSRQLRANNVSKIARPAFRASGHAAIWGFGYLSIRELAGVVTRLDVNISGLKDLIKVECAWALGAGITLALIGIGVSLMGIMYGYACGRLLRETIEEKSARIKQLELILDPGRSGSRLTAQGLTNPEER